MSLVVVIAATPAAIRLATRTSFYDHPADYKAHFAPTPYLGGAAVLLGFLGAAVTLGQGLAHLAPILAAAVALWALGTLDDRVTVSPGLRVAAEALAAVWLYVAGLGWDVVPSGAANLALTIVWVVAVVNAFNLMDNMDGAAATVAALSSLGIAILGVTGGGTAVAVLALALCGACIGFLPYNLSSPARIFLGDGGSMPVGFVVAAAAMALPLHNAVGWQRVLVAILLVGVPVVDTTLVMVSRWRAGVAIGRGGRDHITHRLRMRLGSARTVAVAVGAGHAALCAAAFGIAKLGDSSIAIAWLTLICGVVALIAVFESPAWAPVRDPAPAVAGRSATMSPTTVALPDIPTAARRRLRGPRERVRPLEAILLLAIGAGCAVSPWLYGFYNLSAWGPIALVLLAVVLGLVVAGVAAPRRPAIVALVALLCLWGWSLLSTGWTDAADRATIDASRWLLYAALFAAYVLLLRNDRLTRLLLGITAAGVLALGLYVLGALLIGQGPSVFLGTRLNAPIGYVNGEAGYLLMGVWPMVAVAERARRPLVAGAGMAGVALLAGLVLLCESRAIVPALVVVSIVMVAAVPGRRRRAWILALGLGAVVAAWAPVTHVFNATAPIHAVSVAATRSAGLAILAAAIGAGVAWSLACVIRGRLADRPALARGTSLAAALSSAGLIAVAVVGVVGFTRVVPHPVARVSAEYRAFTALRPTGGGDTRLFSGGGNRYDYWRIAWSEFRGHALRGVGAGNYDVGYFAKRRTTEPITQPHSIELQSLAELGIVGGLALVALIAAMLWGFARRARSARRAPAQAGIAVAGGGMFLTWLVHTSVDWLHLIPGVTGIALAAGAALVGPSRERPTGGGWSRARVGVAVACAAIVAFGAVFVARITLAEHYRSRAETAVASRPAHALSDALRSLDLQESADTRYVQAAAYARLDDYRRARASLFAVVRREPHNFVPWGLLGDLAVRRGDIREARRDYRRGHALNPRDPDLADLARHPGAARAGP